MELDEPRWHVFSGVFYVKAKDPEVAHDAIGAALHAAGLDDQTSDCYAQWVGETGQVFPDSRWREVKDVQVTLAAPHRVECPECEVEIPADRAEPNAFHAEDCSRFDPGRG